MKSAGLSMIEVLTVTAILAILIIMAITMLPRQMEKARDAQRKGDLQKIKIAFEHYYNDNGCYPSSDVLENCGGVSPINHELSPYLQNIPCDPQNESFYLYAPYDSSGGAGTCDGYRVWANLEKDDDLTIINLGCDTIVGCGAYEFFETTLGLAAAEYNYGVSEGVPVFTGNEEAYMESGFCCSGSSGDDCNAWSLGGGNCVMGPYEFYSECISNTVCQTP